MCNYLGIDFGQKKIGLAVSPSGIMAFGYGVIANSGNLWKVLEEVISNQQIDSVVLGLSLSTDGTETPSSLATVRFQKEFQKHFKKIPITTIDERFTSKEAQRNLRGSKKDDKEAARIILQSYLDKRKIENEKCKTKG